MAVNDITINVSSTDYVFAPSEVKPMEIVRLDSTHGSLGLPFALRHANQMGSATKPDRFMVATSITRRDETTGAEASCQAHTVLTVPRSVAIVETDIILAYNLLRTYLTSTVAQSIVRGALQ